MSNPLHQAPDSPEAGDVDTESLYGAAPDDTGPDLTEEDEHESEGDPTATDPN